METREIPPREKISEREIRNPFKRFMVLLSVDEKHSMSLKALFSFDESSDELCEYSVKAAFQQD